MCRTYKHLDSPFKTSIMKVALYFERKEIVLSENESTHVIAAGVEDAEFVYYTSQKYRVNPMTGVAKKVSNIDIVNKYDEFISPIMYLDEYKLCEYGILDAKKNISIPGYLSKILFSR